MITGGPLLQASVCDGEAHVLLHSSQQRNLPVDLSAVHTTCCL